MAGGSLAEQKLQRHLAQMLPKKERIPRPEREHLVRHMKGFLTAVGELIEEEWLNT